MRVNFYCRPQQPAVSQRPPVLVCPTDGDPREDRARHPRMGRRARGQRVDVASRRNTAHPGHRGSRATNPQDGPKLTPEQYQQLLESCYHKYWRAYGFQGVEVSRRVRCTDQVIKDVSRAILVGNCLEAACAVGGVAPRTGYYWRPKSTRNARHQHGAVRFK